MDHALIIRNTSAPASAQVRHAPRATAGNAKERWAGCVRWRNEFLSHRESTATVTVPASSWHCLYEEWCQSLTTRVQQYIILVAYREGGNGT